MLSRIARREAWAAIRRKDGSPAEKLVGQARHEQQTARRYRAVEELDRAVVPLELVAATFASACGGPEKNDGRTERAQGAVVPSQTVKFAFSLPSATTFDTVVVSASDTLKLDSRAVISVDARAGSVVSQPDVVLRDRSRIEGDVTSTGTVTLRSDARSSRGA